MVDLKGLEGMGFSENDRRDPELNIRVLSIRHPFRCALRPKKNPFFFPHQSSSRPD